MSYYIAYFFGGMFLANAVPHFVAGVQGKPFQSPFAKPRGIGLSSSTTNVVWGAANAAAGWALLYQVGVFELRDAAQVATAAAGALVLSIAMSRHFGRLHGGVTP